jgi:o-succinylbenzoate---CoA ligase
MLVEGWLARAAAARPGAVALETPSESRTYEELLGDARAAAAHLRALGVARGDHVAIALAPGLEFARALHACLLLGAIAVPVDVRLPAPAAEKVSALASLVVREPLDAGTGGRDLPPDLSHDLDAPAVVIHTSGTSAAPKPVTLTFGNLLWSALGSAAALGAPASERWLCALPVAHVGGISILVRSAIYATAAVVHERFEVDRALHALQSQEITIASLVATTLTRLLDAGLQRPLALRCALTGGGPVPAGLLDRAYAAGVPVSVTYGLTEAASQVSTTPLAQLAKAGPRGAPGAGPADLAGPPLFCTRVRITPDGEILVAGPTVAPAELARDGWLHTGDLGELGEGGRLHVSGRIGDTIISGGQNVSPAKVESAIEEHPGVAEAAVVASPDEQWGEAVTAVVVWRAGAEPDEAGVLAHCARTLAPYEVPKNLRSRSEPLPRTASGKLMRRELA